ncbi:MUTL-homolog 1 isoform X2 [Wolffia australiana]
MMAAAGMSPRRRQRRSVSTLNWQKNPNFNSSNLGNEEGGFSNLRSSMEESEEGGEEPRRRRDPPKIRRLDEAVVNRIAAGEVVQRPVSAVKELVENSLDAGSTSISVVIKDGGLKLIQVSDNGHGIRYEDLPILCERHTTSKLSAFEDLQTISSMGFRGEALASMSYVGHVSVTTITEGQLHGYRVSYRDGTMEHDPKPCAAVKGTQILVENLFYNLIARKKTLQNSNDDYTKIVDLISRFAIHHISASFSCRKHGANRADVHTVASSSTLEAIRSVYGASIARNLMEISAHDDDDARSIFKMDGYVSDANYSAKKTTMVLFINDRLVECTSLKRAIEVVYSATLPKASKPFIYMSIKLPPEHVDVNIHPTKREVSLLNQEAIIETIQNAVESKLLSSNTVRTFNTQAASSSTNFTSVHKEVQSKSFSGTNAPKNPSQKIVRTDPRDPTGRLHAYFQDKDPSQKEKTLNLCSLSKELMYQQVIRRFSYFDVIQLSNPAPLLDLLLLALKEMDVDAAENENQDFRELVAEMNIDLLKQKREMLQEYFCIHIDEQGNLLKLPVILDQYNPDMDRVPEFLLSLGNDVEWDEEKACFRTIAAALGNFYAMHPPFLPNPSKNAFHFYKKNKHDDLGSSQDEKNSGTDDKCEDEDVDHELFSEACTTWARREWAIQHVLFPSMRLFLKPPKSMATDGTFVQVASLDKLYKIFERC